MTTLRGVVPEQINREIESAVHDLAVQQAEHRATVGERFQDTRSRLDRFEANLHALANDVSAQRDTLSQIRGALAALKVILPLSIGAAWALATLIQKGHIP